MNDDTSGATYDSNDSGWMESEQFYNWFKIFFLPSVKDKAMLELLSSKMSLKNKFC